MLRLLNWLKRVFKGKKKGACPSCGSELIKAKADVVETYGKPVMVCSKCKRLVEL
jgi:DNA-directed RNA polymerase subunit M/transcription elongation factor TFIIS